MSKPFNKRPKRLKRANSTPVTFSSVLPAVCEALRLDDKVREWTVLSLWETILDGPFRGKVPALQIKIKGGQKHLVVKAVDSTVASELTFHLESYRQKLNAYKHETGCEIDRIDLRIGT